MSLMVGLYNVYSKTLANQPKKYLFQFIHQTHIWYNGYIVGRNILHNVLNVQIAINYARHTHQDMIMVQLDLERTYDHENWSFSSSVIYNSRLHLSF